MSQATSWSVPLSGPATPTTMATRIDDSMDALLSAHSGSARPAYAVAGTIWISTATAGKLKKYLYDGTNDRLLETIDIATGDITRPGAIMSGVIQDLSFAPSAAPTKIAHFDNTAITAGQNRAISIPDRNITLGMTVASKVTLPSAASVDFTGIPSGVRRVSIDLDAISTNGTAGIVIQLGTSSGVETTGYTGGFANTSASGTGAQAGPTSSLELGIPGAASDLITGRITLELIDATNNKWLATGHAAAPAASRFHIMAGAKALAAVLDRIRLTTTGSDTFDAGSATITWEF
ncbi:MULTISPECIES: hypothetical protein [unclassified Rhizobium]|uniref:hypothetical protein n=1 Tax=unclassified Rhizobium TaxID=2613769 RepID=UPI001621AAE2|nr:MULTISPECIES: hypothetical protein [unclassified Rhizobium]MBB3297909.1 hypothetical protein [Rhizobium sp. BK112]MBB4177596.1 hypothetical protein [Rhizobium sp. BK109]